MHIVKNLFFLFCIISGMGARKKMNEASAAMHAGSGTDEEHNSDQAQNSARRIDEIFQVSAFICHCMHASFCPAKYTIEKEFKYKTA